MTTQAQIDQEINSSGGPPNVCAAMEYAQAKVWGNANIPASILYNATTDTLTLIEKGAAYTDTIQIGPSTEDWPFTSDVNLGLSSVKTLESVILSEAHGSYTTNMAAADILGAVYGSNSSLYYTGIHQADTYNTTGALVVGPNLFFNVTVAQNT